MREKREKIATSGRQVDMSDLDVYKTAMLSACGTYRYELRRTWHEAATKVVFIGLNPSTADAAKDDPTIRRCVGFAKRWGCGGIIMLNLWPYRATDPKQLKQFIDAQGASALATGSDLPTALSENDDRLLGVVSLPGTLTVCAWGAHGDYRDRASDAIRLLRGRELYSLGLTREGHPKHPLYLRADTAPRRWRDRV